MTDRTRKKEGSTKASRRLAKPKAVKAAPVSEQDSGTEGTDKSYPKTQAFLNGKMDPMLDPVALEKMAQEAVAKGEPDPRPPHFTYVDENGNVVRVTTATGEEEIIGKKGDTGVYIDDTDSDGKIIHLPSGNTITLTRDQWHSLHAMLSHFAYGGEDIEPEEMVEPDKDDALEYDQSVRPQLTELIDAMPNNCAFEEETGNEINPEYVAMDSLGDFWMICGNCIFPITIDHGIARFSGTNYFVIYEGYDDTPFTQTMAYWNWAMLKHDAPGRVFVDYRKVASRTTTAKDRRLRRQAGQYQFARHLQHIAYSIQDAARFIYECIGE